MQAHDVASDLTRIVLGIDRYFRESRVAGSDKLDQEGLVPVHWSPLEPVDVMSWPDARARLHDLVLRASTLPDAYERDWLSEQTLALTNLVRWLAGDALEYEQVVAGTLRVAPAPPTPSALRRARAARERALERAGYDTFAAYVDAELVPPSDVADVTASLVREARRRTEERLPVLRLRDDTIGVKAVAGTPFSAYCDFHGRAVWINTDVPLTRPALKHLVAHEAYPGHDAHMSHREALVREGTMLADGALVITNTASSVLFEGIAECGLDLLEWRDEPGDRVAWAHDRLEWLASNEVAHALNTGRSTVREAEGFLREWCDADDAWIDAKVRFVTHPIRAPFVYGYWWGGTVVGAWWRTVRAARRDRAIRSLYDRMHSPSTLAAHGHDEESNDDD